MADFGSEIQETVVLANNRHDGGEAKTCALANFLGGEEWLEDFFRNLRRNASAGVCNLHDDKLLKAVFGRSGKICGKGLNALRTDSQSAALRHGVAGIHAE